MPNSHSIIILALIALVSGSQTVLADNSKLGIETALYAPLFTTDKYAFGFNYFAEDYEIAIPVAINRYEKPAGTQKDTIYVDTSLVYRKYLAKSQGRYWKPYFGGFLRYAHLEGTPYSSKGSQASSMNKFGMGLNIGFRKFITYNKNEMFYWGGSLFLGKYFGEKHEHFYETDEPKITFSADYKAIGDIELLKIGYVFQ